MRLIITTFLGCQSTEKRGRLMMLTLPRRLWKQCLIGQASSWFERAAHGGVSTKSSNAVKLRLNLFSHYFICVKPRQFQRDCDVRGIRFKDGTWDTFWLSSVQSHQLHVVSFPLLMQELITLTSMFAQTALMIYGSLWEYLWAEYKNIFILVQT